MNKTTKIVKSLPTHRLSMNEGELQELVSILDTLRSKNTISPNLMSLRLKCKNVIEKILAGIKTPDYVPTGRTAGKNAVSMEMLGETEEIDINRFNHEYMLTPKRDLSASVFNQSVDILKDRINAFSNTDNSNHINTSISIRTDPDIPSDDEFAAAELELAEAIKHSDTARMSDSEWEEQRKLYPFLPEVQPD